jgi:hypothetical protein
MSRKNIISQEKIGNKLRVSFQTDNGVMTYEYSGNSAKAFERGKSDPSQLSGRLIEHKKPGK